MNNKRRTKEEIIAQILQSALDGASKSRIMYNSFLNYNQLEKYLEYMVDLGLVKCDDKVYKVTRKGVEYLALFKELKEVEDAANAKHATLTRFLR